MNQAAATVSQLTVPSHCFSSSLDHQTSATVEPLHDDMNHWNHEYHSYLGTYNFLCA